MNYLNTQESSITMSSLEIAELTGKRHDHVLADIVNMFQHVGGDVPRFRELVRMPSGQTATTYNLPRYETDLLITGYSIPYRAAVIKRWHELEGIYKPKSALELARNQVKLLEQLEETQEALLEMTRTKAFIGNTREATAMASASTATKKALALEIELDKSKGYATISKIEILYDNKFGWHKLVDYCKEYSLNVIKIPHPNYPKGVNSYPKEAWLEVYKIYL